MIEETKLRFESFDKFNGLLDISEQSNHERIYTKTCPSISEPQIIITHYEVTPPPPSFPRPVNYNRFPSPPPHPTERGLEMLVREGQHLSFGS